VPKLETPSALDQILENMRVLKEIDQRTLAAAVLKDQQLEAFVEELDDHLTCERAAEEAAPNRFSTVEFNNP
jgi:hypothetical protein